MKRVLGVVSFLAFLLACRPDTVALVYSFPAERVLVYQLHASANASWNIGVEGAGSYEVIFDVTETVDSTDEHGSVVTVEMKPLEVIEDGLPSPGPDIRTFRLRLGPGGDVAEVLEVDGVLASELDPDELAFIGTYRPPLPGDPVRLRQTWHAEQELSVGALFQQINTIGRMDSLRRDHGSDLARISYRGAGPLVWKTALPQGAAELTGTAKTTIDAEFDVSAGELTTAESSVAGSFEVRVLPRSGEAPITGTLRLDLKLTLERTS